MGAGQPVDTISGLNQRGGNIFQWLTEIHFHFSGSREKQVLAGNSDLRVILGSLAVFLWNMYKKNFY